MSSVLYLNYQLPPPTESNHFLAAFANVLTTTVVVSGAVGAAHSKFADPALDILFETLAGTVDVTLELRDQNGEVLTTALYRDGLPEAQWQETVDDVNYSMFAVPQDGMENVILILPHLTQHCTPSAQVGQIVHHC